MQCTLQTIAWAFRTTIPPTTPHSPGALACNYDMIMQTKVKVDWERIKKLRANNMLKNNIKENKSRAHHALEIGDQVLICKSKDERSKESKLSQPTEGPCIITLLRRHGTVTMSRGACEERINIRRLKPFTTKQQS